MPGSRFERERVARGPVIEGYSEGGFAIDGGNYRAALLTPESVTAWDPPDLPKLAPSDVEPVLALDPAPEFLILGTGATMTFPPRAFVRALEERGIGVETMDSRAAARTWSILRSEERWIVAAIMPL